MLLDLPNELLLIISANLDDVHDVYSLLQANRHLSHLLIPYLHTLACNSSSLSVVAYFWADVFKNEPLREILLSKGHPDVHTHKCTVPLRWAIKTGHEKLARLLLRGRDNEFATKTQYDKPARFLARGYFNDRFAEKSWALSLAVECGTVGIVRVLLEEGVGMYSRPTMLNSLKLAVVRGDEGIVGLLLDHGVEKWVGIMLHVAIQCQNGSMVRFLLERRANFGVKNDYGETRLHVVKDVEVARVLGNGAQINTGDKWGRAVGSTEVEMLLSIFEACMEEDIGAEAF